MSKKKEESWINTGWRPALAWSYVAICLLDFIAGPVFFNILQFYNPGQDIGMWQAISLQGGGLYHLSMGAIIGISTHGRTQEKIKVAEEPVAPAPAPVYAPAPAFAPAPAPAPVYAPASVSSGKFGAAPSQPEHPLL